MIAIALIALSMGAYAINANKANASDNIDTTNALNHIAQSELNANCKAQIEIHVSITNNASYANCATQMQMRLINYYDIINMRKYAVQMRTYCNNYNKAAIIAINVSNHTILQGQCV